MIVRASLSSQAARPLAVPKFIVPRQIRLTDTPLRPRWV